MRNTPAPSECINVRNYLVKINPKDFLKPADNLSKRHTNIEGKKMENAMKAAIIQYAELGNMTEMEVLIAMRDGDEAVRNSIAMLMFALAEKTL